MHDHHGSGPRGDNAFEHKDVSAKSLVIGGVLIVVVCVVTFVFCILVTQMMMHGERPRLSDVEVSPLVAETGSLNNEWTAPVRLQRKPDEELVVVKTEAANNLKTFAVVSDEPGAYIYRIPVDKAIDLVAEAGRLPEFEAVAAKTNE